MRSIRLVVTVLAVVALQLATAGTARAVTVSPSGAYRWQATGMGTWTLTSTRQVITCTANAFAATLAADGRGTVARGSTSFSGCSNALLGSFAYAQTSDWAVDVVLAAGPQVSFQLTIPAGGLQIRGAGSSCVYSAGGTITLSKTFATVLPVTIATTDVFSTSASRLVVDTVVNCPVLWVVSGLGLSSTGSYSLDRLMVVSG